MIVTISRQMGSEGDRIAARVAAALGLQLVDRDLIYRMALSAGVPEDILSKLLYEQRRSLAGNILDSIERTSAALPGRKGLPQNPLGGVFAPMMAPAVVSPDDAVQTIGLVIKDVAGQGNVLVLGQGSQMWLRDFSKACHVQIIAPLSVRASRVADREGTSLATARRRVRANDQARAEYLARFHDINWLDPLLYHLIINTGQTSTEAAVSLIVHAAQVVAYKPN